MFQGPYTKIKISPRGDMDVPGTFKSRTVSAQEVTAVSVTFENMIILNDINANHVTTSGLSVNGNSTFSGNYIEGVSDLGTVPNGSSTVTLNLSTANFFIVDFSGSDAAGTVTFAFSNIPSTTGRLFAWQLELRQGGRKARTWPGDLQWDDNGAPSFTNVSTKTDLITFYRVAGRSKTYAMLARTGTI